MLNDVIFNNGDKSAHLDWNIVLTKVEIPLPKIKSSTVDIMGADGILDLSEVLTGDVKFDVRQAKLTFEVMDDSKFTETITDIGNYLHGKNVTFTLNNDEEFYYSGRATINNWECSRRKGKIVITVDCEPYKMEINETVIILPLTNTPTHYVLQNLRKVVCPVIDVSNHATIEFNGKTYDLYGGTHRISNIQLVEGENRFVLSGDGTVKFTYRRGAL